MIQRKNSKNLILIEAFKLFAYNSYDQVTFNKLEEATKLSRGAILYHFASKEIIYNAVITEFVLKRSTIDILEFGKSSFINSIHKILKLYSTERKHFKTLGINNINKAFCNIELTAITNISKAEELGQNWYNRELDTWKKLLENAIETKEVSPNINVDTVANIFLNGYLGTSFRGTIRKNGYDEKLLERTMLGIYNLIKI